MAHYTNPCSTYNYLRVPLFRNNETHTKKNEKNVTTFFCLHVFYFVPVFSILHYAVDCEWYELLTL